MAEEEVTDLTEEEGEESGKKKKRRRRKEKKPKDAEGAEGAEGTEGSDGADDGESDKKGKDKKVKSLKTPKEKKPSSGLGIVLVMLLIALLLAGSVGAALYFDMFSARMFTADFIREPLLDFIVWLDPSFNTVNERLLDEAQARYNQLDEWEEQLKERESDVLQRENNADTRELILDRRSVELDRQEASVREMYDRTTPLYRRDMTEEELEDFISYATTFTRMSPDAAAEILYRIHTTQDVASILYYMSERNRSSILAAFHPDFAAEITNIWIYN